MRPPWRLSAALLFIVFLATPPGDTEALAPQQAPDRETLEASTVARAIAPDAGQQDAENAPAPESPAPATPNPQTFSIDFARSGIFARTYKAGFASVIGHDIVVGATRGTGTVIFNESAQSESRIEVSIDVASIDVDRPAFLKTAGISRDPLSDSNKETIKKNALSKEQLDGAVHAAITFASTRISCTASGDCQVEGKLTIRGVARDVSFPAKIALEDGDFHGTARLDITHTQFGFDPYSAAFGAMKNEDKLSLYLDIWAEPQ